jgi:hypothetical protein
LVSGAADALGGAPVSVSVITLLGGGMIFFQRPKKIMPFCSKHHRTRDAPVL